MWDIAPLTPDSRHLEDWKWDLEMLKEAACNQLKIYI